MNPKTLLAGTGLPLTTKNLRLCDWGMGVTTWVIGLGFCAMIPFGYWELDTLAKLPLSLRVLGGPGPFLLPGLLALTLNKLLPAFAIGIKYAIIVAVIIYLPVYFFVNLAAGVTASR